MIFAVAILTGLTSVSTARAQDLGSAVANGLFQVFQGAVTASAWKKVDQPTQNCLASQYNINVNDMVAQGIFPSDSRVQPDIQTCQSGAANVQQASLNQAQAVPAAGSDRDALVQRYGAKHADLILAGQIAKGMDGDEVTLAWGEPQAKNAAGTRGEVWSYGNDVVSFTNGHVTDVGH